MMLRSKRWMTILMAGLMSVSLAASPVMAEYDSDDESAYEEADGAVAEEEEEIEIESASEEPAYDEDEDDEADSSSSDAESADSSAGSAADGTESTGEEAQVVTNKRPEYSALDYITLGEYKGLEIEVDPIRITDEDIDERISEEMEDSDAGSETFTEGTVEDGDTANIDYEGKKDGVAFDGGTAEGYDLKIGSGTFIDGFEEGLIGVAIGDTVDLNLTFPENYGSDELAGQDVVFTVTVNSVKRMKELDDALASELSDGEAETVEEYRELIKADLEAEAEEDRDSETKSELIEMAAANCTMDTYPQDLVDYEVQSMTEYYKYYASMYGTDFGTFLTYFVGTTEDEFPEFAENMVKEGLKEEYCIIAIADVEGLMPTGDDYTAATDELAERLGASSGEEILESYGEYAVNYTLAHDLVEDFLFENAVITEKSPEEETGAESEEAGSEEAGAESDENADEGESVDFEDADSEAEADAAEASESEAE